MRNENCCLWISGRHWLPPCNRISIPLQGDTRNSSSGNYLPSQRTQKTLLSFNEPGRRSCAAERAGGDSTPSVHAERDAPEIKRTDL